MVKLSMKNFILPMRFQPTHFREIVIIVIVIYFRRLVNYGVHVRVYVYCTQISLELYLNPGRSSSDPGTVMPS